MDFSEYERHPGKKFAGIVFVILLHMLIVYALVTGLARKVVDVIRPPVETMIIEEVKPPAPPVLPAPLPPPRPRMTAPPSSVIALPETRVQQSAAQDAPAPSVGIAPSEVPAPVVPRAAPAAPPAIISAGVVCPNYKTKMGDSAYPRAALRMDIISGEVLIEFTVTTNGEVKNVDVVKSSHKVFERNSIEIVKQFTCIGQGRDVRVHIPFIYKAE